MRQASFLWLVHSFRSEVVIHFAVEVATDCAGFPPTGEVHRPVVAMPLARILIEYLVGESKV